MALKAIETRYMGYRFRSRLEARWAVYFEHEKKAGHWASWEYEPEGFDLGDGVYYLPDFKLTYENGYATWIEVKGAEPTRVDIQKLGKFVEQMGDASLYVLVGTPQLVTSSWGSKRYDVRGCDISSREVLDYSSDAPKGKPSGHWEASDLLAWYPDDDYVEVSSAYAYTTHPDGYRNYSGNTEQVSSGAELLRKSLERTIGTSFEHNNSMLLMWEATQAMLSARFEHGES